MATSYWLCKTEPETYSFAQLLSDRSTHWNDVRNYQARNNLRLMKRGDLVLVYHSGDDKSVVGVAEVVRTAYPDVDPDGGDWSQVDLKAIRSLPHPVTLAQIKSNPKLASLPLIKQSRLSVMPVTEAHYQTLLELGGLKP